MMTYLCHDGFDKEITALQKRRLLHIRDSLKHFQNLCEFHFHPISPQPRIAPGKLHRVTQNDSWTMWKTELPVVNSNLRPNQYPRMWFAQSGEIIVFLCISSHMDNYNDKEQDHLALGRVTDFF